MPPKRKAASPARPSPPKRVREGSANGEDHDVNTPTEPPNVEEQLDPFQRNFYPPEMSNERCALYQAQSVQRPLQLLNQQLEQTATKRKLIKTGDCVVHWFKRDLRLFDNRALSLASKKASQDGVPLVCMFLVSPQDYQAHLTSPARVDFELRSLQILRDDLAQMNIPLYTSTVHVRDTLHSHVLAKCKDWDAKHIFCNIEYEVDELRRESKLISSCLEMDIDFTPVHDTCVVPPETLSTGNGKQFAVYSPFFRAWVEHLRKHPQLLDASDLPTPNAVEAKEQFRDMFITKLPRTPSSKQLTADEHSRFTNLWPAGEHEAMSRLSRFVDLKVKAYSSTRNFPSLNSTALISPHLAAGTLSARTAIRAARAANLIGSAKDPRASRLDDKHNPGIASWISEVAWRDFYKHVLAHWPQVCMSKPFKLESTGIRWETNPEHFQRWCEGRTGYPIVDAAMRQLNSMGWMHNRCRMVTASFLAKHLLLDWRLGEAYFMSRLIDGDLASNNGGWGFSASVGVDPQPYFRIFSPLLQSEKFDAEGEYIRKWVPELAGVQGKAVHDPYGRGAAKEAEKAGYPRPVVEHKAARARALERYKEGYAKGKASISEAVQG